MKIKNNYYRCSICSAVSEPGLRNNPDDPTCENWFPDPKDKKQFLCETCFNVYQDLMNDYNKEDDQWNALF